MYQLYKPNVHQEVAEFIPLIMNTIILQPSAVQRFVTYNILPLYSRKAFLLSVKRFQNLNKIKCSKMLHINVNCEFDAMHIRQ